MKIGFISDAHGNLLGLSRCVNLLLKKGVKDIYFLGDAVGYLPHGMEVINKLVQLNIACIKGNHDAMVCGLLPIPEDKDEVYRLKMLRSAISGDLKQTVIKEWPEKREIQVGSKRIMLVHGRPRNPLQGYLYEDGQIAREEMEGFDVLIMGHTHRPFIRYESNLLLINAGSCGLPRDIGNMASCVVYDSELNHAEILRCKIEVDELLRSCPVGTVAKQVIDYLHRC